MLLLSLATERGVLYQNLILTDFTVPLLMVMKPRTDITGRFIDMVRRNFLTCNKFINYSPGLL